MSTTSIITLLLSSSLLTAILTSVANWYINRNNYRNDYYKKLLDKRLKAYEEVEALISKIKPLVHLDDGSVCNIFLSCGKEGFDDFLLQIGMANISSFWLSDKTSGTITELNVYLLNNILDESDEQNINAHLEQLGIKHREEIKRTRKPLEEILKEDLNQLHDIKGFLKRKRVRYTYTLNPPK